MHNLLTLFVFLVMLSSCGGNKLLNKVLDKSTPYEKYLSSLKEAGLGETALGMDWINAGKSALKDSIGILLPYKETGYFSAKDPSAIGYRFSGKAGEVIKIKLKVNSLSEAHIFADLFAFKDELEHIATMDSMQNVLKHEVEDDQNYILRLQPELLRSVRFTLIIAVEPALAFPVQGSTNKAIQSFFGAKRDAGRRSHEGIDIFADRGTPALAVAEGRIRRVGTNRLGGKVVWLSDANRRQRYYYAHLDSQTVERGQHVMPGDTIGLIGNTGNAITTPPHLHFGIYRSGEGAINPYPFVRRHPMEAATVKVDTSQIGFWHRIARSTTNLRLSPSTDSDIITTMAKDTPLLISAGTDNWYRITLPNGTKGFVYGNLVEQLNNPIETQIIEDEAAIYNQANPLALVMDSIAAGTAVDFFAYFNDYFLVKNEEGDLGWVQSKTDVLYQ